MHRETPNTAHTAINETATMWFVKLQSDTFSEQDDAQLRAWLSASEAHQMAFEQCAKVWNQTAMLDELIFDQRLTSDNSVAKTPVVQPITVTKTKFIARNDVRFGLAAMLMVLVGLVAMLNPMFGTEQSLQYASAFSENRSVELADGSQVMLSGKSSIRVSYTHNERRVYLTQGAAHFDVVSDPSKPFVVEARGIHAKALGTAFEVRIGKHIRVSVDEGTVAVSDTGTSAAKASDRLLQEGQRVDYNLQFSAFDSVQSFNVDNSMAWRFGRLSYDNAPLHEVISDINRYRNKPVVLSDTVPADVLINASFAISSTDTLLQGLLVTHDIRAQITADRVILVR